MRVKLCLAVLLKSRARAAASHLGEPKVCHSDMPLGVEQQVLGLEVAIHDVVLVQARDREAYLGCVELGARLTDSKQVFAGDVSSIFGRFSWTFMDLH